MKIVTEPGSEKLSDDVADRALGMSCAITRRQFMDGVSRAIALSAASVSSGYALLEYGSAQAQSPTPDVVSYPPSLQGIRGQTDAAFASAHAMRDGRVFADGDDTGESYDLVVVGAGMSGLAAAYFFKTALPDARILILEACDDFGGHARRNEFTVAEKRLIGMGGTARIMFPGTYTAEAKSLLAAIGINAERFYQVDDKDQRRVAAFDLNSAAFFDSETYGKDVMVRGYPGFLSDAVTFTPQMRENWQTFLSNSPLSKSSQAELLRLTSDAIDYMPTLSTEQKIRALRTMSYSAFLTTFVGVGLEAMGFLQNQLGNMLLNIGAGPDTFSAWMAYRSHFPGFQGLKLPYQRTSDVARDDAMGRDVMFPDGNATIARLLVRHLIPHTLPGTTMEDSVLANMDYAALDLAANDVRLRLSSTVVRTHHDGEPESSSRLWVTYMKEGRAQRVSSRTCVMACFNAIVPYVCPEMSTPQKDALKLAVRKPLVWVSVAIRNWRAVKKIGAELIASPTSFYHFTYLDVGNSLGGNTVPTSPDDPMIVYMVIGPNFPGKGTAREQYRAGRALLMTYDFATYERNARSQLKRMFGRTGFDPARDIVGITVNRWAHGYACGANDLFDSLDPTQDPCLRARKRFGRIAIANSDAAGISMTQAAMDQAHRAVSELLSDVIRPDFYSLNPAHG